MVQVAGIEINRGEWKRITLWSFWTFNMILNFVYMRLTFATSSNLIAQASKLHVQFSNTTWRAPIASCILGGIMVLMFNIMTCVILIRKSINKSGPGFGFGFIMAWCFVMAFFMMLCGLVLDSFSLTVEQVLEPQTNWSKYDTGSYYGTIAFAFINCIMFIFFFICLAIFQGGITKQLGMFDPRTDEKRKLEAALAARGATMAMPQAQTQMSPINPLAGTANYGPATRI